ncbi:hypothetical protein HK105_205689 [Polyrhizophydium stewartii]|uniref:Uncharacterized protein n=1 Tax=Polyrhizophydium stewartii TaxID=2732419 RepID=A0ABR4N5J3_9FUNG
MPPEHKAPRKAKAPGGDAAAADADAPKDDAKPAVLRGWAKKRHDARVANDAAKAYAASRAGDGDDGDDGPASSDGAKSTPAKRKAASDCDRKSKQPRADSAAARARSRRVPESDSASEDSGTGDDEFGVIERIKLPERPRPESSASAEI